MTKVALDVESVLADSNEAALQSTDKLDRDELLGNWEMDDYTWQVYVGVTDAIWRHKPEIIPPEESRIDAYVKEMNERATVDILTGRQHVDPQVVWWLDEHGIEYESFHSTGESKCNFTEYDLYIDDNPEMVGECGHLLLRDQPWNNNIDTEEYKLVDRIYSLAEVLDYL